MKFIKFKLLLLFLIAACSSTAMALPTLQLGPDPANPDSWTYDSTDTWVVSDTSFNLSAYALDSAWDSAITSGYAYLIAAAVPSTADATVAFDINVTGANLVDSGFGAPPIEDTNTPAPHNVYDTYYQVYEFEFNRLLPVLIGNTETGGTRSDTGYAYSFSIDINSLLDVDGAVTGVHFDLFTVTSGRWAPASGVLDKELVQAIAPYSHDAEYRVPEPTMVDLLAIGLLGVW
jgi:hypothetical protein